MRLALEDEGYEITEVGSSEDALVAFGVALATQPFDVVIIDIMLPGMDGFGCCREIRRHSGVPIIMVTREPTPTTWSRGEKLGRMTTSPSRSTEGARGTNPAPVATGESCRRWTSDPHLRGPRGSAGGRHRPPERRRGTPHPYRVHAALRTGFERWQGARRASTSSRVSGATTTSVTGRLVDVHVRRLRIKVEPNPANPRHVITVRGLGYKLAPMATGLATPTGRARRLLGKLRLPSLRLRSLASSPDEYLRARHAARFASP